jgi:hypothetical protein
MTVVNKVASAMISENDCSVVASISMAASEQSSPCLAVMRRKCRRAGCEKDKVRCVLSIKLQSHLCCGCIYILIRIPGVGFCTLGVRASTLISGLALISLIQPVTPARSAASALGTGSHQGVCIGHRLDQGLGAGNTALIHFKSRQRIRGMALDACKEPRKVGAQLGAGPALSHAVQVVRHKKPEPPTKTLQDPFKRQSPLSISIHIVFASSLRYNGPHTIPCHYGRRWI